jgi:hypothetical protein
MHYALIIRVFARHDYDAGVWFSFVNSWRKAVRGRVRAFRLLRDLERAIAKGTKPIG